MFSLFLRRAAVGLFTGLLCAAPAVVRAQTNNYSPNGTEYSVVGSLFGDQVFPDAAVTPSGGFLVWQDNATDGSGWGLSARRLDSTMSGTLGTFRVNQQGTNDQENPRVTLLKNGGAAFVWQGGRKGFQHIYARFLATNNTFMTTTDVVVSVFTNNFQINPVVTTLNNTNVVVAWSSYNQAGSNSLQDVYARILSPSAAPVGGEFRINQFTNYNQRDPAIAALKTGGFVVVWISEQERVVAPNLGTNSTYAAAGAVVTPSVDVYARFYASNGVAQGNEFLVNAGANPCGNPSVAVMADGGFMVAWSARDLVDPNNGLDIFTRTFTSAGAGGAVVRVNSHTYGDQYAPRISAIGADCLVVWTSLGQDGSREGIFGQFVHQGGSLVEDEFPVNTTTVSQQMQPVVVADGANQFLAVWTSFDGSPNNFDLFAQRYINRLAVMQVMSAPFVFAPFTLGTNGLYQPQLQVSWPALLGISVSNYEVYVDGSNVPMAVVTSNQWTMTAANGLAVSSSHSFRVDYVTTNGTSALSPSASGATWNGSNWGGIPFEWMTRYYGADGTKWPGVTADSDGDGMNTMQEYLSGTIPTNAASVLRVQLAQTGQGLFLNWATQPGLTYQVQVATNFNTWGNLGSPRFAAGSNDSIYVGGGTAGYYRVVLLR